MEYIAVSIDVMDDIESISFGSSVEELIVELKKDIVSSMVSDDFDDDEPEEGDFLEKKEDAIYLFDQIDRGFQRHEWVPGRNDVTLEDDEYFLCYAYDPDKNPWTWALLPIGRFGPQSCWRSHSIKKLVGAVKTSHTAILKKNPEYWCELRDLTDDIESYTHYEGKGLITAVGGQWVLFHLGENKRGSDVS